MEYIIQSADVDIEGDEWPVENTVVKGWLKKSSVVKKVHGSELVSRGWLALAGDDITVFPRCVMKDGEQIAMLKDPSSTRFIASSGDVWAVYDSGSRLLITGTKEGKPSAVRLPIEGAVVGMEILNGNLHIASAAGSQTACTLTISISPITNGLPVATSGKATQRISLTGPPPKVLFSTYNESDRCLVLFDVPQKACFNADGSAVAIITKQGGLAVCIAESGKGGKSAIGEFITCPSYPGNVNTHLEPLGTRIKVQGSAYDVAWVARPCRGWYLMVVSTTELLLTDPWSQSVVFRLPHDEGGFAVIRQHQREDQGIQLGIVDGGHDNLVVSLYNLTALDYKVAIMGALESSDLERAKSVAAQSGLADDVVWQVAWEASEQEEADVKKYFPKLSPAYIEAACRAPLSSVPARWHMLRFLLKTTPKVATYLIMCLGGVLLLSGSEIQAQLQMGSTSSVKKGWWKQLMAERPGFRSLILELVSKRKLKEASILMRLTCEDFVPLSLVHCLDMLTYLPPSTPFATAAPVLPGFGLTSLLHVKIGTGVCLQLDVEPHNFNEDVILDVMNYMVRKISEAGLTQNALQWAQEGWDEGLKFTMSTISTVAQSRCKHAKVLAFGKRRPNIATYESLNPMMKLLCVLAAEVSEEDLQLYCTEAGFNSSNLGILRRFCDVLVLGGYRPDSIPVTEGDLQNILNIVISNRLFLTKEQNSRFGKVLARTFDVQKKMLEDAGISDTTEMGAKVWTNFVKGVLANLPACVNVQCTPAMLMAALITNNEMQAARAYASELMETGYTSDIVEGLTCAAEGAMESATSMADGGRLDICRHAIDLWDNLMEAGSLDYRSCQRLGVVRDKLDTYSEIAGRFPASAPFITPSETNKLVDAVLTYNEAAPDDITGLVSACRRLDISRTDVLSKVIRHAISGANYDLAIAASTYVVQSADISGDVANALLCDVINQFGSALCWEDWSFLTAKIAATTSDKLSDVLKAYPHRCAAYPAEHTPNKIIERAAFVIRKGGAAKTELLLKSAMSTLVDDESQERLLLEQSEGRTRWVIREEANEEQERWVLIAKLETATSELEEASSRCLVIHEHELGMLLLCFKKELSDIRCYEGAVRSGIDKEESEERREVQALFASGKHAAYDDILSSISGDEAVQRAAVQGMYFEQFACLEFEVFSNWERYIVEAEEVEEFQRLTITWGEAVYRTVIVPHLVNEESARSDLHRESWDAWVDMLPDLETSHRKYINAGVKLGYKSASLERSAGLAKVEAYKAHEKKYERISAQFYLQRLQIQLGVLGIQEECCRELVTKGASIEGDTFFGIAALSFAEHTEWVTLMTSLKLSELVDDEEELRYKLELEEDRDFAKLLILQEEAVEKDLHRIERLGLFVVEEEEDRNDIVREMTDTFSSMAASFASSERKVRDAERERQQIVSDLSLSIQKTPTNEQHKRTAIQMQQAAEWKVLEQVYDKSKFLVLAATATSVPGSCHSQDPADGLRDAVKGLFSAGRCDNIFGKDRAQWDKTLVACRDPPSIEQLELSFCVAHATQAAASEGQMDSAAGVAFSAALKWLTTHVFRVPGVCGYDLQIELISRFLTMFSSRLRSLKDGVPRGAHINNAIRFVEGCSVGFNIVACTMNRVRVLTQRPRRARGCFGVAVQPAAFQMADGGRVTLDEEVIETHCNRIFRNHGMFDPPLNPKHEIFQVERFWEELQKQILAWEESVEVLKRIRAGEEIGSSGDVVSLVMLKADRVFKFFTHMRAHLDRNPRDKLALYETRPAGLEDLYGRFLNMLAVQIDTDYCPRCHLRLDGTTSVCGDPTVINEHLYGDNHVFGFESSEMEHSFWSQSWFVEYEKRAKDLWYQALQLPFFRTSSHTAAQCEGMMEIYLKTLNRGEANHFMRQCQVHSLPITNRMIECHKEIIETTNPHSLFFHGEPEAVSPRWLRYRMEQEKLDAMEDEHGMIKHPPHSYLPHVEGDSMYKALPAKFKVDERGWVTDFPQVTSAIQDSVDSWSPIKSQRAQSSEFPDWCYDEHTLAKIEHLRTEGKKVSYKPRSDPVSFKNRTIPNSRSRVPGLFEVKEPTVHSEEHLVFPTAYGYEAFDTSEEAFGTLYHGFSGEVEDERLKYAIRPGTVLRAVTLPQFMEPHVPILSHKFPICENRDSSVDVNKLPIADFCTVPRAMLEVLEYGSNGKVNESIEQWRKVGRPWCDGKWEALEKNYKNLRVGSKFYSGQSAKGSKEGTLVLVGLHNGKLWAARNNEKFASVVLASNFEELKKYRGLPGDIWAVHEQVEVTGVVVGVKDGQLWVQWGANKVATPLGSGIEDIQKNFKSLEVLGQGQLVEPPSWYIPFRNNWAERDLKEALRKPWEDQPFTASGKYDIPSINKDPSSAASYGLDDYKTKEHESRMEVRNLMGGSTKLVGDKRWGDDAVFSVNIQGNNRMHTGYGQPQVDTDELLVPIGPDDGLKDKVPMWEVEEMEQSLRDIGGRAPGASSPSSQQRYNDTTNDPIAIRKQSKMKLAMRASLITSKKNPSNTELVNLESGQLALKQKIGKHESWEYGGMKDPGNMQVMPHDRKRLLGEDPLQPMHNRMHLTGREDEYLKLNGAQADLIDTFKAMNEFYDEMSEPFDVGHTAATGAENNDPSISIRKPSENMSVGHKRRMAGLLLRMWMKKAEETKTTLDAFASKYRIPRLALLAWFGGDSPASPSLLAAVKDWLHEELRSLDLLDEFKIEGMDTYSPVNEPGFYKWMDKSKFDHQYELLLSAKLQRFDSDRTVGLFDPLSAPRATASGVLDVSENQALQEYNDRLLGGNSDIMNKAELDAYHQRTASEMPRVSVNPNTGRTTANIKSFVNDVGYEKEHLATSIFGALTLSDIKEAIFRTLLQTTRDQGRSLGSIDDDKNRADELLKANLMDADTALSFAADWKEGLAMDIKYAIRRNLGNKRMNQDFCSFVGLEAEAKEISEKFDGLYEYPEGAFRINALHVENATLDGEEWQGELVESDGEWRAQLSNGKVLMVRRVSSDKVEWTYSNEDAKTAPRLATAQRADIDLEGAMWRLYVNGNWVPGVDEAKNLVLRWTKNNVDKVIWDVVPAGLKQADLTFINAALDVKVPLQIGEPYADETGKIFRNIKADGNTDQVDCWVNQVPGIPSESTSVVKIDQKNNVFNFECVQEARDVSQVEGVKGVPFEFDSIRTEVAGARDKWLRLGMGLADDSVKVIAREGIPFYGSMVELMHWLDVLLTKMNTEIKELQNSEQATIEQRKEVERQINEFQQIQQDCVKQVLDYQTSEFSCKPILLGNSGYDAAITNEQGEKSLQYDTVSITGYQAKVLGRYLPLLNWWDKIITELKQIRTSEGHRLNRRLDKRS